MKTSLVKPMVINSSLDDISIHHFLILLGTESTMNMMQVKSSGSLPDGMRTLWHYDDRGQLAELVHEDERGILDRYRYEYDLMGNRTAVTKERRGLREESGRYEYGYDALSRLVSVSRDGNALRDYAYDAFGNRSSMVDHGRGRNVSYTYDALNRLIFAGEGSLDAMAQGDTVHMDYSYDNRGNMVREETEGKLIHGYEYGAMNRLSKAWDDKGQEALYRYNGLGQRTGKTVNGRDEDYLLDLTNPYHNLLGITGEGNEQCFYFDWNVAAMEETGKGTTGSGRRALSGLHYYMQDELGSPLRVSGFGAKAGALSGRSSYLCYGYDEFGNDIGRELEGAGIPNLYDGQGEEQPFGYTGYRYDGISGTYFAQAREYQLVNGRFTSEDVVKGDVSAPEVLNQYNYCWDNPVTLIDLDGRNPDYPGEWSPGEETDYTGVYYLNSENGAYTFGHAALMFVREDGSGTFYSFAASPSQAKEIIAGMDVPGYLSKAEVSANAMAVFFGNDLIESDGIVPDKGQIWTDGIDGDMLDGEGGLLGMDTSYTRAIYIPITLEEGKAMTYYAEFLRAENGEIKYNLYAQNCGMMAQDILSRGNKDFAAGLGKGKQIDEQISMMRLLVGLGYGGYGLASQILPKKVLGDYLDMTIPDGAYYSGWIQTHLFLWFGGWETGNLEDFKDRFGGCDNET